MLAKKSFDTKSAHLGGETDYVYATLSHALADIYDCFYMWSEDGCRTGPHGKEIHGAPPTVDELADYLIDKFSERLSLLERGKLRKQCGY